jgi:hypothetical protein
MRVSIIGPTDRGSGAVEDFVETLKKTNRRSEGQILVTERLARVVQNDVDIWLSAASNYLEKTLNRGRIQGTLETILTPVLVNLFDQMDRQYYFREVYLKLLEGLEGPFEVLEDNQPRFVRLDHGHLADNI